MKKLIDKASMARTFRFTPSEWNAIEAECKRLNVSMGFYAKYSMIAMLGKMKPLVHDFMSEGDFNVHDGDFAQTFARKEMA